MYEVLVISPTGRQWNLNSRWEGFGLKASGVEGLKGEVERHGDHAPGMPGQVVRDIDVLPTRGALVGHLWPLPGRSLEDTVHLWHDCWDHERPTQLVIINGRGRWTGQAVLSAEGISSPDTDLSDATEVRDMRVGVEMDRGLYYSPWRHGTGEVTVTNTGATLLHPRIRWTRGGTVTLPSGLTFQLPDVDEERILLLDDNESHAVLTPDGVLDKPLWRQLRGRVVPEGVPRRTTRTYRLPVGARLEWRTTTLNPWGGGS